MTDTANLTIHPDSPVQLNDLSEAERQRLALARPGVRVILDRLPDGTFNIYGNAVVICPECSAAFIGSSGAIHTLQQRHLSLSHGLSYPMLP